jgi:hypothetical protein
MLQVQLFGLDDQPGRSPPERWAGPLVSALEASVSSSARIEHGWLVAAQPTFVRGFFVGAVHVGGVTVGGFDEGTPVIGSIDVDPVWQLLTHMPLLDLTRREPPQLDGVSYRVWVWDGTRRVVIVFSNPRSGPLRELERAALHVGDAVAAQVPGRRFEARGGEGRAPHR